MYGETATTAVVNTAWVWWLAQGDTTRTPGKVWDCLGRHGGRTSLLLPMTYLSDPSLGPEVVCLMDFFTEIRRSGTSVPLMFYVLVPAFVLYNVRYAFRPLKWFWCTCKRLQRHKQSTPMFEIPTRVFTDLSELFDLHCTYVLMCLYVILDSTTTETRPTPSWIHT